MDLPSFDEELGVRLELAERPKLSVNPIRYSVVNDGPVVLLTGLSYHLDRRSSDDWVDVTGERRFRAVAMLVARGGSRDFKLWITAEQVPGVYRLLKKISLGTPPGGKILSICQRRYDAFRSSSGLSSS